MWLKSIPKENLYRIFCEVIIKCPVSQVTAVGNDRMNWCLAEEQPEERANNKVKLKDKKPCLYSGNDRRCSIIPKVGPFPDKTHWV